MKAALAARLAALSGPARLRPAGGSSWLPLGLLLLALATVFLFGGERGSFYRMSHHDVMTDIHLGLARNISTEYPFLGFRYRWRQADGSLDYTVRHRFPLGGYLLIKLFILPFDGNLAAQIYSARLLMLLTFAAAAILSYLSLSRLTGHPWIALTAVLLTFASSYWLFYNDMVSTEIGPDFFGMMLVWHGMVLFVQEGRFRQLLIKSCLALLLGWHSYALIGPFVVMGLAGEIIQARAVALGMNPLARIRCILGQLFRSRYLTLGLATLLWGGALLSFNLAHEYMAREGETELTRLSAFNSMQRRLAVIPDPNQANSLAGSGESNYWQDLGDYGRQQFYRIGGMAAPYALPGYANALSRHFINQGEFPRNDRAAPGVIWGLVVTALAALGLALTGNKRLWAVLVLSGFCWAIVVRSGVADHEFESIIYTGIPLTAWSLLLLYLNRLGGRRFIAALAVVALLVFAWGSFRMAQVGYAESVLAVQEAALADLQAIHQIAGDHTIADIGKLPETDIVISQYLSQVIRAEPGVADYAILPLQLAGVETLTPDNRRLFLYPGGMAAAGYLDRILAQAGPPLLAGNFAVYHYTSPLTPPEEWLFYVKAGCSRADRLAPFYLHLFPVDAGQLPRARWPYGFDNRDFAFVGYRWQVGERCVAARPLPDYPIATIRTGQLEPEGQALWAGEVVMP